MAFGKEIADDNAHRINAGLVKAIATPTQYNLDIRAWITGGTGHGFVESTAGSGKTSQIFDCLVALNGIGESKTLSAFGMRLCAMAWNPDRRENFVMPTNDGKTELITEDLFGRARASDQRKKEYAAMTYAWCKLIAHFKHAGFAAIRPFPTEDDVYDLCDKFNIELPEFEDESDSTYGNGENTVVNRAEFFAILFDAFDASIKMTGLIDFNDMVFMPIVHNLHIPTYWRYIFIDESQDLNPIQIEMVRRLSRNGARCMFVGDPFQAIFGFRGADIHAVQNVVDTFKCKNLPLTISHRCSKAVVRAAQRINPRIEASPNAIEGLETQTTAEKMVEMVQGGDFVLSRTNAPLVDYAFKLIRAGIKCVVRGRDIGKSIAGLAGKIERSKKFGKGTMIERIKAYGDNEIKKLEKHGKKQQAQISSMSDKIETLLVLATDCESFGALRTAIVKIFSDEKTGIIFSSIHKAKGLETNRVFILGSDENAIRSPMARKDWELEQEDHLAFVAITRSKSDLYWVVDGVKNRLSA